MFRRILAPLDGSLLAECVLTHAAEIARAFEAEVTLVQVVESGSDSQGVDAPITPDPMRWQMRRAEANAYLESVRRRIGAAGVKVETRLLEGNVARRIADFAAVEKFDLVAMSTHGHGGLEPWSAGGVAQKVIQRLKTSLLLVRAFETQKEQARIPRRCRILLPLDGSQRAEAALPHAITMASCWNAELVLAHIVAKPACFRNAPCVGKSETLADKLVERNVVEARDYLRRLRARLPVRSLVRVSVGSSVVLALHEVVEQEGVDLVMASAHGQGANRQHRYGSVATETILYGSTPLLVFQDMRPEQLAASAVERWVQESDDVGRWQPVGGRLKSSMRGVDYRLGVGD